MELKYLHNASTKSTMALLFEIFDFGKEDKQEQ
jgi:hypothetical protein